MVLSDCAAARPSICGITVASQYHACVCLIWSPTSVRGLTLTTQRIVLLGASSAAGRLQLRTSTPHVRAHFNADNCPKACVKTRSRKFCVQLIR